ncbi:RNA polymerase sigma factor [Candidatus Flexifilum breve]|uniref:RNA polymerase sigma factor n=1 Tax=Candidatus Flexifilum breve TaxID=3140694 RepID=UPI0031CCD82F
MTVTEAELLKLAQEGDYDAFEALYTALEPGLARFVRRLIGDGYEAQDVVQDTLMSLYVNLVKIDPPEKLRPYVFRIARNRCYDILRRQGRFEQVSIDADEDDGMNVRVSFQLADDRAQLPEEVSHWLLLHLEVTEAIERLPELQRQALILYAEEELSYAEIAEVMNVSMGTVKSRIFHAKQTLRRLLRPATLEAIEDEIDDVPVAALVKKRDTPAGEEVDHGRNEDSEASAVSAGAEGAAAVGGTRGADGRVSGDGADGRQTVQRNSAQSRRAVSRRLLRDGHADAGAR